MTVNMYNFQYFYVRSFSTQQIMHRNMHMLMSLVQWLDPHFSLVRQLYWLHFFFFVFHVSHFWIAIQMPQNELESDLLISYRNSSPFSTLIAGVSLYSIISPHYTLVNSLRHFSIITKMNSLLLNTNQQNNL